MITEQQFEQATRYISGNMTADEQKQFEQLLLEHSELSKEVQLLQQVWSSDFLSNTTPDDQQASEWKKLQPKLKKAPTPIFNLNSTWVRVAAAIILALSFFSIFIFQTEEASFVVTKTESGETKDILLPDGSTVELKPASQLSFSADSFHLGFRTVYLSGTARFSVQRNEAHPFKVQTRQQIVEVLGTVFTVKETEPFVMVSVESGKVGFRLKQQPKETQSIITAGLFSISTGDEIPSEPEVLNQAPISEVNGRLSIRDVELSVVIRELSAMYKAEIILDKKELETIKVSGFFASGNIEGILQSIAGSSGLTLTNKNQQWILK